MAFSDKKNILLLAQTLAQKGVKHVVLCPGSRNAPLSLTFHNHPSFSTIVIPDERSAAYFALGISQKTKTPVVICCTSGTAVLNFAPALAEAYYQEVSLLAITADRPAIWIDQQDGQTIRQKNVYANYINASFEVEGDGSGEKSESETVHVIQQAYHDSLFPKKGPVHINVPLEEPLYGRNNKKAEIKTENKKFVFPDPDEQLIQNLSAKWNTSKKKMIITGLSDRNEKMNSLLSELAEDESVVVLTETSSNLKNERFISCIDRTLSAIHEKNTDDFVPEVLLTFGGPVISKKIKALIRQHKPAEHWCIDPAGWGTNTYQCLTQSIKTTPEQFLEKLIQKIKSQNSTYFSTWKQADEKTKKLHNGFLASAPFCDLTAFDVMLKNIPAGSVLHMGNSTPARYVQLFNDSCNLHYYSNRGTSGIDGCTSTAAGFAFASGQWTTLITGDIGFFYDSNALWNDYLSPRLRIIVINNSGGGIFRIIDHPENEHELQTLFETRHQREAGPLVKSFGLDYYSAENREQLEKTLNRFYTDTGKTAVLEIKTNPELNSEILQRYFQLLKS
ncbi:MAG: 2-succinyl-5-enolpyruvyl-6-hydroxy-3-cyclohexene-1-carboxylic-acid synthase [Bacteroidota bacterium]